MNGHRTLGVLCMASLIAATSPGTLSAGGQRIGAAISYVAVGTVYVNAGRTRGFAVGDTLTVTRLDSVVGKAVVSAVSSNSSAAISATPGALFMFGDSVHIVKVLGPMQTARMEDQEMRAAPVGTSNGRNISGQVALQYVGAGSLSSGMDFSQPGLLMRLTVGHLFNSSARFSMYGRAYRDLSPQFDRYGQGGSRTRVRMFEMSLSDDEPDATTGYSVGRVNSRFAGGMGTFDGAQVFMRRGNLSLGALLGAQPDYSSSAVNADQQKAAVFLNYAWGQDVYQRSNITVAYAQQRYHGGLDRVFMYLQTNAALSRGLTLYESSEFDLKVQENGIRRRTFQPTNTFLTLSYSPNSWLSASAGYDAMRNIYLFKSMSAIPDTLLDRNLRQGFRLHASLRAPLNIILQAQAQYRLKEGNDRDAATFGGGFRKSGLGRVPLDFGVQYLDIRGLYSRGHDFTIDADHWIGSLAMVALRYDQYAYTLFSNGSGNLLRTASLNLNCRLSELWYAVLSFDQIWENRTGSQRVYLEAGLHF